MMNDHTFARRVADAVYAGFDDQTEFLRRLVSFPSTRGNEVELQNFMANTFRGRGYAVETFAMDQDRLEAHPGAGVWTSDHSDAPIVVATHEPCEAKGRSLILQAHVDVVPPGPAEMWTHPPYAGFVDGDWMYGRGAADMKAGASANVFALDALARLGLQPAAKVHVQSVVEEESTGNGALMTHLRGYQADAVLIPEPEHDMLVRANVGVVWFQIEVQGLPAHVASIGKGANAIEAAYRLVAGLRGIEDDWNKAALAHPLFAEGRTRLNLNVGKIVGGDWASSVPCWCKVDCRMSILPTTDVADAMAEITAKVAELAAADSYLSTKPPRVTFNGFKANGYILEPGTDAENCLAAAHETVFETPLKSFVAGAYLDARVYSLYDKFPVLCYGPYGENTHGFDERVSLKSLQRITTSMAIFIAEWCGLEPIPGR